MSKTQRQADKQLIEAELDLLEEEFYEEYEADMLEDKGCGFGCQCCCCTGACCYDYDGDDYYMSAWDELNEVLGPDEEVECIIFGPWGWGGYEDPNDDTGAPEPRVPPSIMGRRLILTEAEPFLKAFSFSGGYGSPDAYATWIYTNKKIMWVTQYDGSTGLSSMPRNPIQGQVPYMPGG